MGLYSDCSLACYFCLHASQLPRKKQYINTPSFHLVSLSCLSGARIAKSSPMKALRFRILYSGLKIATYLPTLVSVNLLTHPSVVKSMIAHTNDIRHFLRKDLLVPLEPRMELDSPQSRPIHHTQSLSSPSPRNLNNSPFSS